MRSSFVLSLLVASACAKPGAVDPPEVPNPASVYCLEQGGTLEIVETPAGQQGICVLPSGVRCDEWAFFRGECPCDDCPMWTPPAPGFCSDGTIVAGAIDACGCQGPPVCERKPVVPATTQLSGRYEHTEAEAGPWSYTVAATAMGSRSERRIGRLRFGRTEVMGKEEGDYVDTPWGRLRWLGPVSLHATTDYEQGFLLLGVRDRSLDELEGDAVFPSGTDGLPQALRLVVQGSSRRESSSGRT